MVQQQIVDYINSQMKAGIPRDSIKAMLTGAGWAAADVEDTLKQVESSKGAQATAPAGAARTVTPITAGPSKGPEPQMIKVSDLISSPGSQVTPISTSVSGSSAKSSSPRSPLTGPGPGGLAEPAGMKTATSFEASSYPGMKAKGSKGGLIMKIVMGVVILGLLGLSGFLYMQNNGLTSQVSSLNTQTAGVDSQLNSLQSEVAASTTALTAQVATLNTEIQELQTELSFYAASPSSTPGVTSTANFSGTIASGKTGYMITAMYGGKAFVLNSKDPNLVTVVTPLLATTSTPAATAQFGAAFVPGSDGVTIVTINTSTIQ